MRKRLGIVIAVASVLGCGAAAALPSQRAGAAAALPAPRAGAARTLCGPIGAHTLAASAVARAYSAAGVVYGCAAGGARSYRLGQQTTCIMSARVAPVTVAGRLAAYGLEQCGVDTGFTEVVVLRLTDGTVLHEPAATSPAGPESYQSVDSLVLRPDGAVAWIGTGSSLGTGARLTEVRRLDRRGEALLDAGSAVRTRSLRLRGSQLSWLHGAARRTATLR